jgi:hypothetical protein
VRNAITEGEEFDQLTESNLSGILCDHYLHRTVAGIGLQGKLSV